MLPELHDRIRGEHPEFSDEEIFSFRDGHCPADLPAGRHPVCPNDEHRHGGSARSCATRSAAPSTTSAARCHDGTRDNDHGARVCTRGSTPGDRARSFAIAGAVTSYDDYDVDPDFDRQG
jgi:hypothetical protein